MGGDKIPPSHIAALWDLQAAGYRNHLVSYCGAKREQEVRQWLGKLPVQFDEEHFCRQRCGPGGKVEYALKKGIDIVLVNRLGGMEERPVGDAKCHKAWGPQLVPKTWGQSLQ